MHEAIEVEAEVWLYPGKGGWHFISVPAQRTDELRVTLGPAGAAWGSVPVLASMGGTDWETSLFFDAKSQQYLVPIKASVRKREDVGEGDVVRVRIRRRGAW